MKLNPASFLDVTLLLFFVSLINASFALAQTRSNRLSCPKLDAKATSADQALCWFDADRRGLSECIKVDDSSSACILHAVDWCEDAAFDAAPVSNACFLAYVRAGQLDEALSISDYLQTPVQEAQRCREALTQVSIRIVSTPPATDIKIDGLRYGKTPVEVKLIGNWWTKKVVATYGEGVVVTEVEVSKDELINAFDRSTCVMEDLLIEGPKTFTSATNQSPILGRDDKQTSSSLPSNEDTSTGLFANRTWTWVALGGAVAFGIAIVTIGLIGESQYDDLMKTCANGCEKEQF